MTDEKTYYYIVGVRGRVGRDLIPTLSCDFVIEYTSDEISKVDLAKAMIENELFPTTTSEAIDAVELNTINAELNAISMRVRMNPDISVHKFISSNKLDNEWFDTYIKLANILDDVRQKLIESRINI